MDERLLPYLTKMRIALANWTNRQTGGAETYIGTIAKPLASLGHDLVLFSERDSPKTREPIQLPDNTVSLVAADGGYESALERLLEWKPDVIYVNGLEDQDLG